MSGIYEFQGHQYFGDSKEVNPARRGNMEPMKCGKHHEACSCEECIGLAQDRLMRAMNEFERRYKITKCENSGFELLVENKARR